MAITARNLIQPLTAQHLEAISRVWADTETGFAGSGRHVDVLVELAGSRDVSQQRTP
jgi:hypothetical protein